MNLQGPDDLKQKLLYTTLELESVRAEANEEMRKTKEYMKQLLQLFKVACQERDEARDQLQKLLNKLLPSTVPSEFFTSLPQLQPDSPLIKAAKANSSITESNSLSDTHNCQSHGSSPVDSFLDAGSSPELSNLNMADSSSLAFVNQPLLQDYTGTVQTGLVSSAAPKIDQGSLVIDNFVTGKPLPQKGKLLQAVLESGPLLQTLLLAGPLPRWRNPPPLQAFNIPPVFIKGCGAEIVSQKPAAPNSLNSSSFVNMATGSSKMLSSSMMHFAGGSAGSGFGSGRLVPAGAEYNSYAASVKRQRLQ